MIRLILLVFAFQSLAIGEDGVEECYRAEYLFDNYTIEDLILLAIRSRPHDWCDLTKLDTKSCDTKAGDSVAKDDEADPDGDEDAIKVIPLDGKSYESSLVP